MKYQPSLPGRNDNVSDEHPLKDFLSILVKLAALALLAFFVLGLLVDAVVDRMDASTEAALTRLIADKAPGVMAAPDKPHPREAQLQALVDSLRSCARLTGPATVRLTESKVPNAVVVPGGNIYVFSALLEHVQSENGLAFVLAHELAHLSHRDHLRALGRGIVLYGLAALLSGDTSALATVLAPVRQLGDANYSRARESAADARALQVLACRYGHAGGATEFFQALDAGKDKAIPGAHYFDSHPAMRARIAAIQAAVAQQGLKTGAVVPLAMPK